MGVGEAENKYYSFKQAFGLIMLDPDFVPAEQHI